MCDNGIHHHDSANQEELSTPDSLLPPSEPPDIKNWFSSYEYESLVLETNDNYGFSDDQETQQSYGKENNILKAVEEEEEEEDFKELVSNEKKRKSSSQLFLREENQCPPPNQVLDSPSSSLLSTEPPPGIDNWFSSYAYESPTPDTIIFSDHKESMVEPCNGKVEKDENLYAFDDLICNQRLDKCGNGSTKHGENSTGKHLRNNKLPNHGMAGIDLDSNEYAQIFPRKLSSCRNDPADEDLEVNGDSWQRTRSGKHEEEEKENDVGNGFVSIKNKREKNDKSMRGNGKRSSSCVHVGKTKDESERRRKTLADMTNIQPGKWKCPRKSKPDIGPPLKQLQLGQWFHRQ